MLQLCAFQMSAQAFNSAHMTVSITHPVEKSKNTEQHGNNNSACTVSNCITSLPLPVMLKENILFSHVLTITTQQALHGLPPVLSKRPPKSVFA